MLILNDHFFVVKLIKSYYFLSELILIVNNIIYFVRKPHYNLTIKALNKYYYS